MSINIVNKVVYESTCYMCSDRKYVVLDGPESEYQKAVNAFEDNGWVTLDDGIVGLSFCGKECYDEYDGDDK